MLKEVTRGRTSRESDDFRVKNTSKNRESNTDNIMYSMWKPVHPIQFKRGNQSSDKPIQFFTDNVFDENFDANGKAQKNRADHDYIKRPEGPTGGLWQTDGAVELAKDHIIPYDIIRDYTYVISQLKNEKNKPLKAGWIGIAIDRGVEGARDRFYNTGGLSADSDQAIYGAKQVVNDQRADEHVINDARSVIRSAVSWMPGNVVMAPKNRSDDAHGGFDDPLLEICDEDLHYKELFNAMNRVIESYKTNGKADLDMVKDINTGLKRIAFKTKPYPYKEEEWDRNRHTGQYKVHHK